MELVWEGDVEESCEGTHGIGVLGVGEEICMAGQEMRVPVEYLKGRGGERWKWALWRCWIAVRLGRGAAVVWLRSRGRG